MKGHSDMEAKGVALRLALEPLGEVKKGVLDPPRVLDVELPRSCRPPQQFDVLSTNNNDIFSINNNSNNNDNNNDDDDDDIIASSPPDAMGTY